MKPEVVFNENCPCVVWSTNFDLNIFDDSQVGNMTERKLECTMVHGCLTTHAQKKNVFGFGFGLI